MAVYGGVTKEEVVEAVVGAVVVVVVVMVDLETTEAAEGEAAMSVLHQIYHFNLISEATLRRYELYVVHCTALTVITSSLFTDHRSQITTSNRERLK